MSKRWKKPGSSAGPPKAPFDPRRIFESWAQPRIVKKGLLVQTQLVRVRGGALEDMTSKLARDTGHFGLFAAAHILLHRSGPVDLVGVVTTMESGRAPGRRDVVVLSSARPGDLVVAHRAWVATAPNLLSEVSANVVGGSVDTRFTSPDYRIDPVVERELARAGLPGAVAHPLEPERTVPGIRRQAGAGTLAGRHVDSAWEAMRTHGAALRSSSIERLVAIPRIYARAVARPPGIESRSVDELAELYGSNDALMIGIVVKLGTAPDFGSLALRIAKDPRISRRVRAYILACATERANREGATAAHSELVDQLCDFVDTWIDDSGGEDRWLAEAWPLDDSDATRDQGLGCVQIATIASVVFWRAMAAGGRLDAALRPREDDTTDTNEIEIFRTETIAALEGLEQTRDRLLTRLLEAVGRVSVESGPGERVRTVVENAVGNAETTAARRRDRLEKLLGDREPRASDAENLRATAVVHAALLHNQAILVRLALDGLLSGERSARSAALLDVPLDGLNDEGLACLGRACVVAAEGAEPSRALALLNRARTVAAFDSAILECANEGRFRLGDRSADLLADLADEARIAPGAGVLATLAVLYDERRDARLRPTLRELIQATAERPNGAIARAFVCLRRPGELADRAGVESLARALATDLRADPRDRWVHALLGDRPELALQEMRDRFGRQAGLLREAAALRIERVEEALTRPPPPRRERPAVPGPGPGCVTEAIAAVRWRLSRPGLAAHPLRSQLHAHLRSALSLCEHEDRPRILEAWLDALRGTADESGLVPSLDLALIGDDAPVAETLREAERRRVEAHDAAWIFRMAARLAELESRAGHRDAEWRSALADARSQATGASDGEARAAVEDVVARLSEQLNATPEVERLRLVEAEGAPGGFRAMVVSPTFVDSSASELDTPSWAIEAGLRQVRLFNAARGRRDMKMLASTRGERGPLWELRHHDARHPVRVLWRMTPEGPIAIAVMIKDDEDDQRRVLQRIADW